MTVSENTIQSESLGDFFKNLGKKKCIKEDGENCLKKSWTSSRNWDKRWYCICFSKPESSFINIGQSDKNSP